MTATQAFESKLQKLCLDNFPSGLGPWRQDYAALTDLKKSQLKQSKLNINNHSAVTLKEYGANFERTEALSEYVASKKSPWLMDYSWSAEARSLRELAVKSPWLIDKKFIFKYFKTLRILDQEVKHIDPNLKFLSNLEELTLSANYIQTIPSENLPPKLRVLELCANCIDDLESLTKQPPPLEHLGLGRNNLSDISDYISGAYWPNLLSLDLSNNHLCGLQEIVACLATLPRLRCLVLNGNPLSLIPGYRGFVIDSLRKLLILDDGRITSDEKHYFRGLARRKDNILDENVMTLVVESIKNLPVPDEIKSPADFPEYPVIVRKYLVQFWYPEANVLEPTARSTQEQETEQGDDAKDTETKAPGSSPDKEFVTKVKEVDILSQTKEGIDLQLLRSDAEVYNAEGLELKWSRDVVCNRLREIRDFFGNVGLNFDVVEEKSLLYPPDEVPAEEVLKPQSGHKKGKKEDKAKAESPKKEDKGKKKKKLDEDAMVVYSKEYSILASFWVSSASFLDGEFGVEANLSTEGPVHSPPPSPVPQEDASKGKKKDDKKSAKDKGGPKSGKSGKSGKKDDGISEAEDTPPPPLQVKVAFRMHHWRSVKDCPTHNEAV